MKKVLTFRVFDYFHIGHLNLFKKCKEYGDYLIVGVQEDEYVMKVKPNYDIFYNTGERLEMINALSIVDEAFTYDMLCEKTMEMTEFDVLVVGEKHYGKRFDEITKWCNDNGKEIVRIDRTPGISSSLIKKKILDNTNNEYGEVDE